MATNTKKTTTETKPVVETKAESTTTPKSTGVEKMIQENTPAFVSNGISIATKELESFRLNYFNSPYIFYPLLLIVIFLILRHLWYRYF